MTGYMQAYTSEKTSLNINIWETQAGRVRLVKALKRDGKEDNFEAYFRRKDGAIIRRLMSASVINLHGVPHFLNVTRNITSIDQAEGAL